MTDKWGKVESYIQQKFNKKPDINAVLFLIGIRELGLLKTKFNKEEKTELLHIALCKVLSYSGYYKQEGVDERGWQQWKSVKKIPSIPLNEQEKLIKQNIIEYFEKENIF